MDFIITLASSFIVVGIQVISSFIFINISPRTMILAQIIQ
jgi:hypothetical protein